MSDPQVPPQTPIHKPLWKQYWNKAIQFFFQGLIFTAPLGLTAWVLYKVYQILGEIGLFESSLANLVVLLCSITLLGSLASSLFGKPFFSLLEKVLESTPMIKIIYSSIKDLIEAFVGDKKKFDKPVMVTLSKDSNLKKLGFITQEDMNSFGLGDEIVAVYMPHSYAFSGTLFLVSRENIEFLNPGSAEVMKFIVSGGVAAPTSERQLKEVGALPEKKAAEN